MNDDTTSRLTRRDIGKLSVAAGLAGMTTSFSAWAEAPLAETDLNIKTPDGVCDAVFIHPATGTHPGIIIWTDAYGLRQTFRDMARRLASEGYAVLVPNPYYRNGAGGIAANLDFDKPDDRSRVMALMATLTPEAITSDAKTYIEFLDTQPVVRNSSGIGTSGYCMGGKMAMFTAAARPDRIRAAASFHGGGLATDKPDSPHLLIPKMKADFYFGISGDDDEKEPEVKTILKDAYANANLAADIEVYEDALHGWCVPDAKPRNGQERYNKLRAEEAWGKLLALYKKALS